MTAGTRGDEIAMSSFLLNDLARLRIEQRRAEAVAHSRAKLARRSTAKAKAFLARLTNRPRVPERRRPAITRSDAGTAPRVLP